jgi:hypothetical protein
VSAQDLWVLQFVLVAAFMAFAWWRFRLARGRVGDTVMTLVVVAVLVEGLAGEGMAGLSRMVRDDLRLFHSYRDWSVDRWRLAMLAGAALQVANVVWGYDVARLLTGASR